MWKPKLNSTVSVVKINDTILEFFLTNIRQQVRIRVENDSILEIVTSLDGQRTVAEIAKEQDIALEDLTNLLDYLKAKGYS